MTAIRFDYIDTKEYLNFPVIEINDIEGAIRLAEANGVKYIFRISLIKELKKINEFFFPIGNIIYRINGNSYNTLEDFHNGNAGGFIKAEDYYEAIKGGFQTYEEFDYCRKLGIDKKYLYMEARNGGFVKGFPSFKTKYEAYKKNTHKKNIPDNLDNVISLYQFAKSKGFSQYHEFEKVYDAGYPDLLIYNEANAKGFKKAEEFYIAIKAGFNDSREYEDAKRYLISSKKEYGDFIDLKKACIKNMAFDEFELFRLLNEIENGKKLATREIKDMLLNAQEKHKRSFEGENVKIIPLWYTKKLDKEEMLIEFLSKNEHIKKIGFFDSENDSFEIFKISRKKIYIDASNVAYGGRHDKNPVPKFKYIQLIISELKTLGFVNITAIADATLIHKTKDHNILEQIKKEINYIEVPSHTSADDFLIQSAKRDRCFIVSNDTFTDWKSKDKWISLNVDNIRLPFIITKDKVVFSGIERLLNNKVGSE
jgi:hypothetical protein